MSSEPDPTVPQIFLIDVNDEVDVALWAAVLNTSPEAIRHAVTRVGPKPIDVWEQLKHDGEAENS